MIRVDLDRPVLTAHLPAPMRLLSWAPYNAGYVTTDRVIWREVRNADLTPEFDAITWLADLMQSGGTGDGVAMLTSRNVTCYQLETTRIGATTASCCATVGLSNAERVGHRLPVDPAPAGTINLLTVTDARLSDTALLEAMSIATQARTAAVMEAGPDLPTGRATGTGTDCIAVACHPGDTAYAGLHTEVGEALGRAVYDAVLRGAQEWMATEAIHPSTSPGW